MRKKRSTMRWNWRKGRGERRVRQRGRGGENLWNTRSRHVIRRKLPLQTGAPNYMHGSRDRNRGSKVNVLEER